MLRTALNFGSELQNSIGKVKEEAARSRRDLSKSQRVTSSGGPPSLQPSQRASPGIFQVVVVVVVAIFPWIYSYSTPALCCLDILALASSQEKHRWFKNYRAQPGPATFQLRGFLIFQAGVKKSAVGFICPGSPEPAALPPCIVNLPEVWDRVPRGALCGIQQKSQRCWAKGKAKEKPEDWGLRTIPMSQPRVKREHKARLMQRYHPLSGSLKLIWGGPVIW